MQIHHVMQYLRLLFTFSKPSSCNTFSFHLHIYLFSTKISCLCCTKSKHSEIVDKPPNTYLKSKFMLVYRLENGKKINRHQQFMWTANWIRGWTINPNWNYKNFLFYILAEKERTIFMFWMKRYNHSQISAFIPRTN